MAQARGSVLVTGGSGFVGTYIVRALLNQHYKVRVLVRPTSDLSLLEDIIGDIDIVQGDLLDIFSLEEAMEGMDFLINAAAVVSHQKTNRKRMLQVAIQGTGDLADTAIRCGIKKMVHISSIAALGRMQRVNDIDENQIFGHSKYDTSYGLSKFLAEQEIWRAVAEGLPAVILSPSFIIGAGKWNRSTPKYVDKIFHGLRHFPSGINGFVDVRDVARATISALESPVSGERFIISAENRSYEYIFKAMGEGLQIKTSWKTISPALRLFIKWTKFLPFKWHASMFSLQDDFLQIASTRSSYQHEKSLSILHMDYTPLSASIEDTCKIYLQSVNLGKSYGIMHI